MAYLEIVSPEKFTEKIQKVEDEDYITAALENEIKCALLNNDVFLKTLAEAIQKKSKEHIENGGIHVTKQDKENWSGKASTTVATQAADGLESAADKKKLDEIAAGAEVNQFAFSKISVGDLKVTANEKTSTIVLQAGSNITISADNASKKIVITSNKDGGNADKLDGYHAEHFAVADHGHDGRYYTKTESDNLLNQKAASNHNHNGGKYLAGQGGNGGYSFINDGAYDTGMFSDSDGDLYFMQNGTKWYASHTDHVHDYIPTNASCNRNWNWVEQESQPIWVWGGNDMTNMYVYHPSRFHVEYADSAGAVAWEKVSGKPNSYPPSNHSHTRLDCQEYTYFNNNKRNIIVTGKLESHDAVGNDNILLGSEVVNYNRSTSPNNFYNNVCIGYQALKYMWADMDSVYIDSNVAIGAKAGIDMGRSSSADCDNNVLIGRESASNIGEGRSSVMIGAFCGAVPENATMMIEDTFLGSYSGSESSDVSNATAIGSGARVTGDNQVQLGNRDTTVYAYSALNNRSDRRDKTDIRDTQLGLEFLLKHRPVEFRWDLREAYQDRVEKEVKKVRVVRNEAGEEREEEYIEKEVEYIEVEKDGSRAGKRFHEGFIAQEVEAIMKEMEVDFAGLQNHNMSGGADRYTIGYTEYIPIIVKAIQELKQMYDEEIKHLKEEIILLKSSLNEPIR